MIPKFGWKLLLTFLLLAFAVSCSVAQKSTNSSNPGGGDTTLHNAWTWIGGAPYNNQLSSYGTKGVVNSGNVPGARSGAAFWIDALGNAWIFGGSGFDSMGGLGTMNDLWKFDGTSWTWISGTNAIDQRGVYGTKGVANSDNCPGTRTIPCYWTDNNGNLWIFGGFGYDASANAGRLGDLWKFDGTNWTWVLGTNVYNIKGLYGVKGVASNANCPGGRNMCATWKDASGNLWLFGGYGVDGNGLLGDLSDLWKFDGSNWTWVSGSSNRNVNGVYGSLGVASPANYPGSRREAAYWIDGSGNFWLFGGGGYDGSSGWFPLSDLWKFDGSSWCWVSGKSNGNQPGMCVGIGVASNINVPGGRNGACGWRDASGNFWVFGGTGFDCAGGNDSLNDLWKFDGANWTMMTGSIYTNQIGTYGTKTVRLT